MTDRIEKDNLFYHAVHGLCRVAEIHQKVPASGTQYVLLPVSNNPAKIRFVIPSGSLAASGFARLICAREAHSILEYFKTGAEKQTDPSHAWKQAAEIRLESCSKEPAKEARRRQRVDRAVRGLAGELAFVLKMTLSEIVEKIQKNLGLASDINPLVLAVLADIRHNED